MRFMSRTKNRMNSFRQSQYDSREFIISMTDRKYSDLQLCDSALKVWLPEHIIIMLYEITVLLDVTISDFVRQMLFVHLYGKYDLLGHIERTNLQFKDPDEISPCAKTTSPDKAVPCSKISITDEANIRSLKIPLPSPMKQGLLGLADKKHLPISEYVRRLIITHLIGHQEVFPTPPTTINEADV